MHIGHGSPSLRIPRPGKVTRRYWGWNRVAYDEYLENQRKRFAATRVVTVADRKRQVRLVQPGITFRLLDGHGKSFGKRIHWSAGASKPVRWGLQVRIVNQQPETLHSQASRMLKRAHRLSMLAD